MASGTETSPSIRSPLIDPPETFWDRIAVTVSDYCSPILVKQVRQNVKSRIFLVGFHLMLLACLIWSFYCVVESFDRARGIDSRTLLLGFSVILGVPMILLVPLSSFEAIASFFREQTFDLLSITTSSSRKIVYGVFGSSILQSLVFFCGVLPCLVFGLVLQGVDVFIIGLSLYFCFLSNLALVSIGILLGALSSNNTVRLFLSMLFLLSCIIATMVWIGWNHDWFYYQIRYRSFPIEFLVMLAIAVVATIILFLEAAVSLVGFPSENRSSNLRMVLNLPIVAWLVFFLFSVARSRLNIDGNDLVQFWQVVAMMATHYLFVCGCFMCSERKTMSKRVQRSLPTSPAQSALWSLLFPGMGRGYQYSLVLIIGWNLALVLGPIGFALISQLAGRSLLVSNMDYSLVVYSIYAAGINIVCSSMLLSIVYLLMRLVPPLTGNVRVIVGFVVGAAVLGSYYLLFVLSALFWETMTRSPAWVVELTWGGMNSNCIRYMGNDGFPNLIGDSIVGFFMHVLALLALFLIAFSMSSRELFVQNPKSENTQPTVG